MCAKEIVNSVCEGYNGAIMAYGQTGAGKTFTMSGSLQNFKYRGLMPRIINHLFQQISMRADQIVTVRVSYIEIYNELLYDLLSDIPPSEQSGQNLQICDDAKGEIQVKGMKQNIVANEEEALHWLFQGETNRTISEHILNKQSSRSHCVFTIYVESRSRVESREKVIYSKLHLVDLAGSERSKKTGSKGITLLEANFINRSLSYLEQVVVALSDKNMHHIPYRSCKLTNLLKDSLGGNAKTLMIANIWPEPQHLEETISTLRFASRMMRVSNEATVNVQLDPQLLIKKQEKDIKQLKQELAMHDTLQNRGKIVYDPYTPEEQYQCQKIVSEYLDGMIEDIEFESIRQAREMLVQFRFVFRSVMARLGSPDYKFQVSPDQIAKKQIEEAQKKLSMKSEEEEGVGEEEIVQGFGLGKAAPTSKPLDSSLILQKEKEQIVQQEEVEEAQEEQDQHNGTQSRKQKRLQFKNKAEAFEVFKTSDGVELSSSLDLNKNELKIKKQQAKQSSLEVNDCKTQIDQIKEKLDQIRQEKQDQQQIEVIDEEEFTLIKELKDLKHIYREKFDILKNLKTEIAHTTKQIEVIKTKILSSFDVWYEQVTGLQAKEQVQQPVEVKKGQDFSKIEEEDPDAVAYIKAKKNVSKVHKAKKAITQIKLI